MRHPLFFTAFALLFSAALSSDEKGSPLHKTVQLRTAKYDWEGPLMGWDKKQKKYLKMFDELKHNSYLREHCDHDMIRKVFFVSKKILIREEYEYLDEMMSKIKSLIEAEKVSTRRLRKIYRTLYLFEERGIKKSF